MCRFNYKASVQSDIFIRNLAGKIVKDVPELGNSILADDHALDYLEEYRCRQDPFLCLEIAIIAPLKHIQTDKKYLIIIDALDECDTPMGNDLYDLLAKRTHLDHTRLLICMASEVNCYDTANLIIQLITQSGLSSSNMSNAAFIASSNGNFKTLISFHEKRSTSNRKHAVLLDDWRLITCESALNAAVRYGHLRIVKSLLEEKVNTLHCEMFDGRTPLMTAAIYDQTEVFRYLHDSGGNFAFRCKRKCVWRQHRKPELDLLTEKACPENGSISHLLAIHNSYGIIKYLLKNGFDDWESRDSKGLTPLHYAFCSNSNNFIKLVVFADKDKVHLNLNSKSSNGSTPYHSAAICKSLILSLC
ncbi:unnamed protein product [Mytilus edulis]|uniref:Nephrocystin 3-like N-terminal domain-containing protein n=1 Tax=Mytilus edulis TaxID=6550 RepID=A0A8S3V7L3_MYTED|nr:unnamed protein product [Mytilus edulis]